MISPYPELDCQIRTLVYYFNTRSRGFSSPLLRETGMKNRAKVLFILLAIIPLIASSLVVATFAPSSNVVFAAGEGEGTATIDPTAVIAGDAGKTMTITYAAGTTTWSNGRLEVTVPTGWSTPSQTQGAPGYVTVDTGSLSVFSQTIRVDGINVNTVTIIYGNTIGDGPGATAQTTAGVATFAVASDPEGTNPTLLTLGSPSVTVKPAAPSRLEVTGSATMDAGTTNALTITAKDQYGNVCNSEPNNYTGVKSLTFSGPGTIGVYAPTVTNKDGDPVNVGSATTITFTNGVSTAGGVLTAYKAQTTTVDVTDGSISSLASAAYDLDLTVTPGPIHHYTVTSDEYTQIVDVVFTVTVTACDQYGNVVTTDSTTEVCMSSNSDTMVFDGNGDGTFRQVGDECKTLTNGTFDIPAKDSFVGSNITITATDGNVKTGTSLPYTIVAGTPTPTPTPTPTGPTIAFSPSSFTFMATEGGDNPASKTLTIWNSGTGTINWSLADNADWLAFTPTGGSSTGVADKDSVTLSVDISGMSAGSNSATITISASGATNTPKTVTVTLTILTPQTPTNTVGTAESWVEGLDGKVILHFRAGSFASETNISIALKTIHGEAPEDFTLGETCFSITAEAELLRSIDVCVRYTDADVAAADGDPGKLRLAVYDETEGEWDVLSTSIDERTRTACARVKHLSDFAILAGPGPPGFFSADWWTVWWHITPIAAGLVIVIAVAIWLWSRYRYY